MKRIAILGSTGSVGVNALRVISGLPREDFEIIGLAANSNVNLLARQIRRFRPKMVSLGNPARVGELKRIVNLKGIKLFSGPPGLEQLAGADEVDLVVMAVLGNVSLLPLVKAVESGKTVALASKEPLVSAGVIIMGKARESGAVIIPVDSEHSAVFQCLRASSKDELRKIYLTGSGGPLRNVSKSRFDKFPPNIITRHPKWRMGKKISVDSATMMNKGLEVIEAMRLFDIGVENIEVLIHPEAIVHSMVELKDGSVLAQLAYPDMRLPIQYALTYPKRVDGGTFRFDIKKMGKLTFHKPDMKKFPCLEIAYEAARRDGTYPAVMNAANEEAVSLYLKRKLEFTGIPRVIEKVIERHRSVDNPGLDDILEADYWAREEVRLQYPAEGACPSTSAG